MQCQRMSLFCFITLRNNPEERSCHLRHGWSLKSCIGPIAWFQLPVSNLNYGTVCSNRFLCRFSHSIQEITKPESWWGSNYFLLNAFHLTISHLGTAVAQWLRCCVTNQKVAGLIPNGVTGIFHWRNPSDRTMGPGVGSASNRYEYQEYLLGVKATSM